MSHASDPAATPEQPGKKRNPVWAAVREVLIIVVVALVISLVVKTFFFRAFYIPSGSMEETLQVNDRIFANLMAPGPFELNRGDVVVFRDEEGWLPPIPATATNPVTEFFTFVGLVPDPSNQHLIKRIIGMPGDTVSCCSADGKLAVNGTAITEPYIFPGDNPSDSEFTKTVPEGKIWVMGDHRAASADSRYHEDLQGGFVDISSVEGRAAVISWPLDRIGGISGHHEVFASVPAPDSK
ncbi:signal peptidase I [Arthrobacter sp. AQ5-05]|uniref:signal peptidase I n=1 Tax=Arthrobacter sp. AQ5-05 TaxID=2184581 RepID=UPI000DCDAEC0|nr:signal peptidase I [Arthrobacter sp. AQ5-05]RAX49927.1 signal peptidase I [Arthrobacter sp. AQ5-05]